MGKITYMVKYGSSLEEIKTLFNKIQKTDIISSLNDAAWALEDIILGILWEYIYIKEYELNKDNKNYKSEWSWGSDMTLLEGTYKKLGIGRGDDYEKELKEIKNTATEYRSIPYASSSGNIYYDSYQVGAALSKFLPIRVRILNIFLYKCQELIQPLVDKNIINIDNGEWDEIYKIACNIHSED